MLASLLWCGTWVGKTGTYRQRGPPRQVPTTTVLKPSLWCTCICQQPTSAGNSWHTMGGVTKPGAVFCALSSSYPNVAVVTGTAQDRDTSRLSPEGTSPGLPGMSEGVGNSPHSLCHCHPLFLQSLCYKLPKFGHC